MDIAKAARPVGPWLQLHSCCPVLALRNFPSCFEGLYSAFGAHPPSCYFQVCLCSELLMGQMASAQVCMLSYHDMSAESACVFLPELTMREAVEFQYPLLNEL